MARQVERQGAGDHRQLGQGFHAIGSERVGLVNRTTVGSHLTAEQVREKTGVAPAQIVDWLSLMGDSVDNIPGVSGVGPKTATELLNQFGSVEALYARLPEVAAQKMRLNLDASAADVRRNQRLIRLNDDLGIEWALDDVAVRPVEVERLGQLFARWGFRSMLRELTGQPADQGELFGRPAKSE